MKHTALIRLLIKDGPIKYTGDIKDLKVILSDADEAYYNSDSPILSDDEYDKIREFIVSKDNTYSKVGSEVKTKVKVKLPVWMGSMDKRKDSIDIKGDVVVSDKLDGVSCLYVKKNGVINLYTRGDGVSGTDITNLIDFVNIPKINGENCMIRGELIMKTKVFDKLNSDKQFSNARNTVSGVVNSKKPAEKLKNCIDFIAYEVINPQTLTPQKQFEYLEKNITTTGLIVFSKIIVGGINDLELYKLLGTRKTVSEYEIDGIIVSKNVTYVVPEGKNPKHAFAFKESATTVHSVQSIVTGVEWKLSKDRFFKPVVKFEEIVIKNVKIKKATGFNAKYISDNKIGPGAVIEVIRSGDVIPYIKRVVKGGITDMPDVPYIWSGDDIYSKDENMVKESDFIHLIDNLKIDHLGKSGVNKLFEGGVNTLKDLKNISVNDLNKIFGKKTSENIATSIRSRMGSITCLQLMVASNVFGRGLGKKTLDAIIESYPFNASHAPSLKQLTDINGVGKNTAEQYLKHFASFGKFIVDNELTNNCVPTDKINVIPKKVINPKIKSQIFEKNILFTGFRSEPLTNSVIKMGGNVLSSFTKNIDWVVYSDKSENNKKVQDAKSRGILTHTKTEFEKIIETINNAIPDKFEEKNEAPENSSTKSNKSVENIKPVETKSEHKKSIEKIKPVGTKSEPTHSINNGLTIENKQIFCTNILFTGFRSVKLSMRVAELGGDIDSKLSEHTDWVVYSSNSSNNKKVEWAKQNGLLTNTKEEFEQIIKLIKK